MDHCIFLVTTIQCCSKGLGILIQILSALFCANDGIVVLPQSYRLQGAFNTQTGLFDRLGLRTNEGKIVSMV